MKRLVNLVTLALLLVRLVLVGLNDTDISVDDTSIPDNGVTSSVSSGDYHFRMC